MRPLTPESPGGGELPFSASLRGAAIFHAKAFALRRLRTLRDWRDGGVPRHPRRDRLGALPVVAEIRSPLWPRGEGPAGEHDLIAGKIHNLRQAAQRLDGTEVPAGALFSFWAQVGRASRRRGFVKGRELREGCMIAGTGGGLCQLSNALYAAALEAGLEVVERHPHSRIVPGSEASAGRDATVFWNYIDLRLRSRAAFRIEAHLTGQDLVLAIRSDAKPALPSEAPAPSLLRASDCGSCDRSACSRHAPFPSDHATSGQAWLITAPHPEFAAYFADRAGAMDHAFLPTRLGPRGAAWPRGRWSETTADFEAMRRRISLRRASSGADLQRATLASDARLARIYAQRLSHLQIDLTVSQALLPHLWQLGVLQGRRYDVLLERLPYAELHARLDWAVALLPDSPTLGEFRAPAALVDAETRALAGATCLITAHQALARLDPDRTLIIPWSVSTPMRAQAGGRAILFPASALARKGAYAVRDAIQGLDVDLVVTGSAVEHPAFWRDAPPRMIAPGEPLPALAAVVLPALVEHRPEPLAEALAAGIPVIATDACGLPPHPDLHLVARGDAVGLRRAIETLLAATPATIA